MVVDRKSWMSDAIKTRRSNALHVTDLKCRSIEAPRLLFNCSPLVPAIIPPLRGISIAKLFEKSQRYRTDKLRINLASEFFQRPNHSRGLIPRPTLNPTTAASTISPLPSKHPDQSWQSFPNANSAVPRKRTQSQHGTAPPYKSIPSCSSASPSLRQWSPAHSSLRLRLRYDTRNMIAGLGG